MIIFLQRTSWFSLRGWCEMTLKSFLVFEVCFGSLWTSPQTGGWSVTLKKGALLILHFLSYPKTFFLFFSHFFLLFWRLNFATWLPAKSFFWCVMICNLWLRNTSVFPQRVGGSRWRSEGQDAGPCDELKVWSLCGAFKRNLQFVSRQKDCEDCETPAAMLSSE